MYIFSLLYQPIQKFVKYLHKLLIMQKSAKISANVVTETRLNN